MLQILPLLLPIFHFHFPSQLMFGSCQGPLPCTVIDRIVITSTKILRRQLSDASTLHQGHSFIHPFFHPFIRLSFRLSIRSPFVCDSSWVHCSSIVRTCPSVRLSVVQLPVFLSTISTLHGGNQVDLKVLPMPKLSHSERFLQL